MTNSTVQHEFDSGNAIRLLAIYALGVWVGLILIGLGVWGFTSFRFFTEHDPDLEREKIEVWISPELRTQFLSPEVRELLIKLESRQVSGHREAEFQAAFRQATEVHDEGDLRRYRFPVGKFEQGQPQIEVTVRKKTGRIIRCAVSNCP